MGTFTALNYHIVFGTKYRRPTIRTSIEDELHRYAATIISANKGIALEINGTADHLHILCALSPTVCVSDTVRLMKSNSSKWMNERSARQSKFEWQTGYAAFTVSYSNVDKVRQYNRDQKSHHATRSYRDEYIQLLSRHNLQFEMKYLFEDEHVG